jgi:monoamine oxidase
MDGMIFHPDFKARPYWWEEVETGDEPPTGDLPAKADVVIVGGGLTGLNCAIELGRGGTRAVVLEGEDFGFGASTRSGGGVSGGTNLGKGMSGAKGAATTRKAKRCCAP